MLDYQLYGVQAGGHHLTNLFFHLTNTLLLFLLLTHTTGALWPSALVAALFALHPMHVESVAWVSERKDVLSAFFWLATLWGLCLVCLRPEPETLSVRPGLLRPGLMAKPMLVTLPLVLLSWTTGR